VRFVLCTLYLYFVRTGPRPGGRRPGRVPGGRGQPAASSQQPAASISAPAVRGGRRCVATATAAAAAAAAATADRRDSRQQTADRRQQLLLLLLRTTQATTQLLWDPAAPQGPSTSALQPLCGVRRWLVFGCWRLAGGRKWAQRPCSCAKAPLKRSQ
jgi:hypothetical protein